ncbi:MAG TPA: DUF4249 domain-containing protein [Spirosoma sp.]|nr:DUF4249 domain-containing protein [Spirosoma sp.]
MRSSTLLILVCSGAVLLAEACVDPLDLTLPATGDLLVVDGTLTDLAEPQVIRINRSQVDRLTGRFSTLPLTKARVEVIVDSSQVIACPETLDGSYQLPSDFKGQVGHAYQLRFTLNDGTRYASTQQVMPAGPPLGNVSARFNPTSLPPQQLNGYRAAHDIYIDTQDPAGQHNYYRWEWTLWERQYWCHSCRQGVYSPFGVLPNMYKDRDYFVRGTEPFEDCFSPPAGKAGEEAPEVPKEDWIYDYGCQSPCWHIIKGYDIVILDDRYIGGGLLSQQRVARIPFYNARGGLVDVRQLSLTADAYRYYQQFQEQTQHSGGVADTPPTVMVGNVRAVGDSPLKVVGYFSASTVSQVHFWLDRRDTQGVLSYGATGPVDTLRPPGTYGNTQDGLFYAFNAHQPNPEPPPPYLGERTKAKVRIWPNADRPPLAPCRQGDNQTPFKPEGWRD